MNKLSRSDCRLKWGNMVLDLHSRFQTERAVETEDRELAEQTGQEEDQKSDVGNETDVDETEPVKEKKNRKPRRKP